MNPNIDWKVIFGGIGFAGLALYQFSVGDVSGGVQSVLAAIAAFGVKTAVDNNSKLLMLQHKQFLLLTQKPGDEGKCKTCDCECDDCKCEKCDCK